MKIGIIGLGLMGSSIARQFLKNNYDVFVYNRTLTRALRLESEGAIIKRNPKEVADSCDLLFFSLTDFNAISDICNSKEGVLTTDNYKLIICDTSTISFNEAKLLEKVIEKKGLCYLNTPVMGGPKSIENKELISIVSGNKSVYETIKDSLLVLAKTVFYVGETPGNANIIKLALNLNIAFIAMALGESITLIKKSQVDPQLFIDILNSTYYKTGLSLNKGKQIANNDFSPSFYLKHMEKDLQLVIDSSNLFNLSLPITALCTQFFKAAKNSGFAELDYTSIHGFMMAINNMREDS